MKSKIPVSAICDAEGINVSQTNITDKIYRILKVNRIKEIADKEDIMKDYEKLSVANEETIRILKILTFRVFILPVINNLEKRIAPLNILIIFSLIFL